MRVIVERVLTSSYLFFIPILIWNGIFGPKLLDVGYLTKEVDFAVLKYMELGLRICIFSVPLLLSFDTKADYFHKYLIIYFVGMVLYFVSWLFIIYGPELSFTNTWFIQLAPAYLPLIWLMAVAILSRSRFYGYLTVFFILVHVLNTYLRLKGTF